jgi:solute carrier family 45 protein 1/2/4
MMVGAVIVSACLLVLGFTREIVGGFMGAEAGSDAARRVTVVLAVAAIYAVDFAINMSMLKMRRTPCL